MGTILLIASSLTNFHSASLQKIDLKTSFTRLDVFHWFWRYLKGHFPLAGIFRAERHFLLFKDQFSESGRQKTKENIIPRGKFRLVENGPKVYDRSN